ncbi:hypothetical protein HDU97_007055 [Phlyctochytrium planicorne]|nr:hypothetical protein HDU97_007055 [Phlyctochytrium planicorne]
MAKEEAGYWRTLLPTFHRVVVHDTVWTVLYRFIQSADRHYIHRTNVRFSNVTADIRTSDLYEVVYAPAAESTDVQASIISHVVNNGSQPSALGSPQRLPYFKAMSVKHRQNGESFIFHRKVTIHEGFAEKARERVAANAEILAKIDCASRAARSSIAAASSSTLKVVETRPMWQLPPRPIPPPPPLPPVALPPRPIPPPPPLPPVALPPRPLPIRQKKSVRRRAMNFNNLTNSWEPAVPKIWNRVVRKPEDAVLDEQHHLQYQQYQPEQLVQLQLQQEQLQHQYEQQLLFFQQQRQQQLKLQLQQQKQLELQQLQLQEKHYQKDVIIVMPPANDVEDQQQHQPHKHHQQDVVPLSNDVEDHLQPVTPPPEEEQCGYVGDEYSLFAVPPHVMLGMPDSKRASPFYGFF